MKNLIFQYYIPYESFDADMGGKQMPEWAHAGSRSAKAYAEECNAHYVLSHDRFFQHLDPRLDSLRLVYDSFFDDYDNVLCLDLDMLVHENCPNIFQLAGSEDISMVHELGLFQSTSAGWLQKVMNGPLWKRGVIAYGKKLFGDDWSFPKSEMYPQEPFRYLNGGLQMWTKTGRIKARKHFTSVDNYYMHTRYTEQMYINIQLSQSIFKVQELDTSWNRVSSYQWQGGKPDGKINHFLARAKFDMPKLENTELSKWQGTLK